MSSIQQLCESVRAISPMADLTFLGVLDREHTWIARVRVRDVILIETEAGTIDQVIAAATKKIHALSQRIVAAATQNQSAEPSSDTEVPAATKSGE